MAKGQSHFFNVDVDPSTFNMAHFISMQGDFKICWHNKGTNMAFYEVIYGHVRAVHSVFFEIILPIVPLDTKIRTVTQRYTHRYEDIIQLHII